MWWIDEPGLLGSANPVVADLELLRRDGFGVLISLLKETEQPRYGVDRATALGFVRHTIPVEDYHAPTVDQLGLFVTLVSALPPGPRTVVHCEGGSGRTGTSAAAYWVASGLSAPAAIAWVRETRPHAVETAEQEAAVGDFAARWRREGGRSLTVDEFFTGYEASRPLFKALRRLVDAGGESELRVSRSQIAFVDGRRFAWVWVPDRYLGGGHAPLVLSVALPRRDTSSRWKQVVEPSPGRFMHHLGLQERSDLDEEVRAWIQEARSAAR